MTLDISEKNSIINYAVQTSRIADILDRTEGSRYELSIPEKRLFELALGLVEDILNGAYYVYKPEKEELEPTFIGLRNFRISYPVFSKLKWVPENTSIIENLNIVKNYLNEIISSGLISYKDIEYFNTSKDFFNHLSSTMHETMLINKENSIENYSSKLWPELS